MIRKVRRDDTSHRRLRGHIGVGDQIRRRFLLGYELPAPRQELAGPGTRRCFAYLEQVTHRAVPERRKAIVVQTSDKTIRFLSVAGKSTTTPHNPRLNSEKRRRLLSWCYTKPNGKVSLFRLTHTLVIAGGRRKH
jgi:hypothetical protein